MEVGDCTRLKLKGRGVIKREDIPIIIIKKINSRLLISEIYYLNQPWVNKIGNFASTTNYVIYLISARQTLKILRTDGNVQINFDDEMIFFKKLDYKIIFRREFSLKLIKIIYFLKILNLRKFSFTKTKYFNFFLSNNFCKTMNSEFIFERFHSTFFETLIFHIKLLKIIFFCCCLI